jgi:Undecaprenyl-phosphate galactose phosphotransferase WbaP
LTAATDVLTLSRENATHRVLKSLVEVVSSLLLAPFMLLAAVLISVMIRLDSVGPVVIGLPRVGRGGRLFRQWKFRTMTTDADERLHELLATDPARREEWERTRKLHDDPRLTRVGRLLRRTSLDELPQIFNVLVGEMSLIGPRPIAPDEVDRYGSKLPLYLTVRPGLTGLWQVSGRSDLTYPQRVALDTHYVLNWSIKLDLLILFRTVWAVLTGRGAY